MSDRLAVSATISVLMMSVYVLFGSDTAHAPIGPFQESAVSASGLLGNPGRISFID